MWIFTGTIDRHFGRIKLSCNSSILPTWALVPTPAPVQYFAQSHASRYILGSLHVNNIDCQTLLFYVFLFHVLKILSTFNITVATHVN